MVMSFNLWLLGDWCFFNTQISSISVFFLEPNVFFYQQLIMLLVGVKLNFFRNRYIFLLCRYLFDSLDLGCRSFNSIECYVVNSSFNMKLLKARRKFELRNLSFKLIYLRNLKFLYAKKRDNLVVCHWKFAAFYYYVSASPFFELNISFPCNDFFKTFVQFKFANTFVSKISFKIVS